MVKKIILIITITIILSLGSGCKLNNDGTQLENLLYASWHNNLNFELANFNKGLELITSYTEKEINGDNLNNLYFTIEMFADTNNLFILRSLKNAENIPEDLRNKLISPKVIPHLNYVFETVDTLKEIDKKILELSKYRGTPLPEEQKELVQAFYENLIEIKELYQHISYDITRTDLSNRSIEELQKIHHINENIIELLPHLGQQQV